MVSSASPTPEMLLFSIFYIVFKASALPGEDQTIAHHLLECRSSCEVGINCQGKDCTLSYWSSVTRERKVSSRELSRGQISHRTTSLQCTSYDLSGISLCQGCHQEPECSNHTQHFCPKTPPVQGLQMEMRLAGEAWGAPEAAIAGSVSPTSRRLRGGRKNTFLPAVVALEQGGDTGALQGPGFIPGIYTWTARGKALPQL